MTREALPYVALGRMNICGSLEWRRTRKES